MNETAAPRRRVLPWIALLVLVVLGIGAGFGWRQWQSQQAARQQAEDALSQRWAGLEQNLEALRRDQRATNQRLQDAAATNRILRDEMLGLSQRGALLEETVERLSDPDRHGAQALRLDEVELLLDQGQQRLAIAGDLDGARRAYALAAGVLQGVDDPGYLNLRQALVQERNALDALGPGPRVLLARQLDAALARLPELPRQVHDDSDNADSWWQRALSPLVQIRPSRGTLIAASERRAAEDALQIEASLARSALERGDAEGFARALHRIDEGMARLWPDSPELRALRAELARLGRAPLRPDMPELGSTLRQLQAMREGRQAR